MRPKAFKLATAIATAMVLFFAGPVGAFANPNGNNGQGQGQGQGQGTNENENQGQGQSGNTNKSGNSAQQDPSLLFGGDETYGYSTNVLEMILASKSFADGAEGADPKPLLGIFGDFAGKSLLRVTSSEFSFESEAGLTPPSRWVAVDPESDGSVEASGSAPNLEDAIGVLMISGTPGQCGFLTFEIFGLDHVPGEGAPVMREAASETIRACVDASNVESVELAAQMLEAGSFVPRHEDGSRFASLGRSLHSAPGVCTVSGHRLMLNTTGTCEFNLLEGSVVIGKYRFEILTVNPDDPTWGEAPPEESEVKAMMDSDEVMESLLGNEDWWTDNEIDPNDDSMKMVTALEIKPTAPGIGTELSGMLKAQVDAGEGTKTAVVETVKVMLDDRVSKVGDRFAFGALRTFWLKAEDFKSDSDVKVGFYSTYTEVGVVPNGEVNEELTVPEGLVGNHTMRITGVSPLGVLWVISVPVSFTTTSTGSNFFAPAEPEATEDEPELSEPEVGTTPSPTPSTSGPLSSAPTATAGGSDTAGSQGDLVQVSALGPVQPVMMDKTAGELTMTDVVIVPCQDATEVRRIANVVVGHASAAEAVSEEKVQTINESLAACEVGATYTSAASGLNQRGVYDFGWPIWVMVFTLGGWIWLMAKRRRSEEETQ